MNPSMFAGCAVRPQQPAKVYPPGFWDTGNFDYGFNYNNYQTRLDDYFRSILNEMYKIDYHIIMHNRIPTNIYELMYVFTVRGWKICEAMYFNDSIHKYHSFISMKNAPVCDYINISFVLDRSDTKGKYNIDEEDRVRNIIEKYVTRYGSVRPHFELIEGDYIENFLESESYMNLKKNKNLNEQLDEYINIINTINRNSNTRNLCIDYGSLVKIN